MVGEENAIRQFQTRRSVRKLIKKKNNKDSGGRGLTVNEKNNIPKEETTD